MPQRPTQNNHQFLLIGEDDPDDQELLSEIFLSIDEGLSLVFEFNGEAILNRLESLENDKLPSIIILDYNMPGLTGQQILEELKKNPGYSHIPKIIWSTSRSSDYRDKCMAWGASDYLVKPSNIKDLTEACRQMLSFIRS